MAYEENIRIIAEEVERLKNQLHNLDVEIPEHPSTDAGKILAVDSNGDLEWKTEYSYTPPDYSTEEFNTGQKWIDGKDIYCKVFSDTFPAITETRSIDIGELFIDSLVSTSLISEDSSSDRIMTNLITVFNTGVVRIYNVSSTYSEFSYKCIIYYTKPDPVPSTETTSKKKGAK